MHELRRPASGFQQWTLTGEESQPYFRQAVELGITFWDTANVYSYGGSEEIVDGRPSG
jgi:aryl-alcohol dehydrogenase-like predicted oxidoreductase